MRLGAALALIALLLVMGLAVWLFRAFEQPFGRPGNAQTVQIPRGMGASDIGELLEEEGVISSATLMRVYLRLSADKAPLQAGEYRFEGGRPLSDVVAQLRSGRVVQHRLTVPEGLDLAETTAHISAEGWGSAEALLAAAGQAHLVADLDPKAGNLEGYLFPETYFLTRDVTEVEIVTTLTDHFRDIWTVERQKAAQDLGLSVREVVTLASLIEKETSLDEERPLVSSVFHNRLKQGMRLACDPTVIYAVKLIKPYDGIIHRSDLDLDSPYNTYLYPGLPPGPIANPGLKSIDAALNPATSDFLYFVSRNDGSHVFSTNYRDHDRAVRRYQRP